MNYRFPVSILLLFYTFTVPAQDDRTAERLKKALQKFPAADTNSDGVLTMEEFTAFRESSRPSRKAKPDSADAPQTNRYTTQELTSRFEAKVYKGVNYRIYIPETIAEGQKIPLILSLHGAGGKGSDNRKNLSQWNGTTTDPEFQKKHPCIVVVPQSLGPWRVEGTVPELTPELIASWPEIWQIIAQKRRGFVEESKWANLATIFEMLDTLAETHPVDEDRVYVLGHSMGGFGTFESLAMAPDRFAAAIPSAGGLAPWHDPAKIAHIPIWAFHGENDTTVPIELTQGIFDRLKTIEGSRMKLTRLGGVGHGSAQYGFAYQGDDKEKNGKFRTDCSSEACDKTEQVWEWLFRQSRNRK